jgi:phage terminase Nu1 subunit (DNA packaging protein)
MTQQVKNLDGIVVNTKVLANIFGVTERRVRQMVEEEIIERIGHGRYNLQDSIKKYIAFLRASSNVESDNIKLKESLDYEKFLHEKAKREKAELELAHIKGTMHHASEVERVMTRMLSDFRAKLLALPSKVAPMLIARKEIAVIQDILQKEIYEALQELSEYDPTLFDDNPLEREDNNQDGEEVDE